MAARVKRVRGSCLERHPDAMDMREVEANFAGAFDEGVALGVLDLEMCGEVGGWGGEDEDGAALVFLSNEVDEGGAGTLEVDVLNLDVVF